MRRTWTYHGTQTIHLTLTTYSHWEMILTVRFGAGQAIRWRCWDKRLLDMITGPVVTAPAAHAAIYDALSPARRAWLTRWFGRKPEGA